MFQGNPYGVVMVEMVGELHREVIEATQQVKPLRLHQRMAAFLWRRRPQQDNLGVETRELPAIPASERLA